MSVVPHPMSMICFLRGILWSIALWKPIGGHRFVESSRSKGQPKCVLVLRCKDCGAVSVGWETCNKC